MSGIRVGISSATFFNKLWNEDVFDELRALNCDLCEVFLTTFSEYENSFAELLKSRKGAVEVHSLHTLNTHFEPELFNPNPRTFADARKIFERVLGSGKILDAKNYTFHGPARLKKRKYVFDFDFLGGRLQELVDFAAEFGITLCYENVHWTYFSEPDYFAELKKRVKGLGSCLDIKQAMQSGIDWKKYVEVMGGTLKTVHVCDYDETGRLALPGRGIFDFPELIRVLDGSGCSAPLLLELYANDYQSFEEVGESFEYIKSLVK